MDRRLRFLKGIEDSRMKNNPRFRLKGEQEAGVTTSQTVLTRAVQIKGNKESGYTVNKYTSAMRGDQVEFGNATMGDVSIQFPVQEIFGQNTLTLAPVGSTDAEKVLTVSETAPVGTHVYAAFCHDGGQFAVGGSMPIIIINPKDDR